MTLLLFLGLYGYSRRFKRAGANTSDDAQYVDLKIAWQLKALMFYEPWLQRLYKKGLLQSLKIVCRKVKIEGDATSNELAVVMFLVYMGMLSSAVECIMVLLLGSWRISIFMAGLFVGSAIAIRMTEEAFRKILKNRQRQISQHLPVFLTKMILLMGAGINVKAAWEKAIDEKDQGYFSRCSRNVITDLARMGSLSLALEHMSSSMADYRVERLAKLLMQMRDYGDASFLSRLEALKLELWQERLRTAREMAEESKVKLLLPLFMTFGGVMLVIMLPILVAMRGVVI